MFIPQMPLPPAQSLIPHPRKHVKAPEMLLRLGIYLETTSYIIGIFFVVSYVTSYYTQNEVFYKADVDNAKRVTNLPAYTICPTIKSTFIGKQLNRLQKPNNTEVINFAKGLVQPKGVRCRNCDNHVVRSTFEKDLRALADELSEPCENFLLECTWNGEPFQCCRHFQRISATCFSLNSAHSREPGLSPKAMTTSLHKPEAILVLTVSSTVRVHVHDSKDLDFPPVRKIKMGGKGEIIYKFTEWTEDATSWTIPIRRRNCTLIGERDVTGFRVYSQSGCRLRCEASQQYAKCGCKHHLLPGPERDCDLSGLICLDEARKNGPTDPDVCECLEECTKIEVSYVRYSVDRSPGRTSTIVVSLSSPPMERFVLTPRVTLLDVIVTIACVSRLVTNRSLFRVIPEIRTTSARSLPSPSATPRSPPSSESSHPTFRLNSGNCLSVR